jgi:hypothetical protein
MDNCEQVSRRAAWLPRSREQLQTDLLCYMLVKWSWVLKLRKVYRVTPSPSRVEFKGGGHWWWHNMRKSVVTSFFFEKHNTNTDTHICMSTHLYERTHTLPLWAHPKDWVGLILRFTKSVTKSILLSTGTSSLTKRIINYKYNNHIKSRI